MPSKLHERPFIIYYLGETTIKIHKGLTLALALFLTGSVVTVLAYAQIIKIEAPQHSFEADFLTVGDHHFLIKAGQNCVGKISMNIWQQKATGIRVSGVVNATANGADIDAHISGEAYFNPLGQMSESSFNLIGEGFKGTISTSSIQPIALNLSFKANNIEKTFSKEIPGPLLIAETSPGKLELQYNQAMPMQPITLHAPAAFLRSELKLSVESSDKNGCPNPSRMDLSKLLTKINSLKISNNGTVL